MGIKTEIWNANKQVILWWYSKVLQILMGMLHCSILLLFGAHTFWLICNRYDRYAVSKTQ